MVRTIWVEVGVNGVTPMNIEDVSGYGDKISLQLIKNLIIQFTMKRDLYRFAKARRHGERIYMWEAEWHKKHNEEYYKQNKITTG